jgi:hypothetical protein
VLNGSESDRYRLLGLHEPAGMTKWDYDKLNAEEKAALLPVPKVRANDECLVI